MPGIEETRRLPYSARQMYDLVADVGSYPQFLPWVVGVRIRSDSEAEMVADLLVGFKALRERFTSRVAKVPGQAIEVHYVDGPLRDLDNRWQFRDHAEGGCEVEFSVRFTFRNALFERIAGQYFDRAFRKMVTAFEERAAAIYGSSSSSATSVA